MLTKLWNGNYSLVKTYWLFYVIVWGVFSIPIRWFSATNERLQAEYLNLVMLSLCLFVAYGSIALVGLWRSARKYDGRFLWAVLAKIIVCIGVLIQMLTIFGVGKSSLLHGAILFLSLLIPLVSFYLLQKIPNKKYAVVIIVCLVLLIPMLMFSMNFKEATKSKWLPLLKWSTYSYTSKADGYATTYLDFNSVVKKNGFTYAFIAREFFENAIFKKTIKEYLEFDCSVPKFRGLSIISYAKQVEDGFGPETGRTNDLQAKLAKSAVNNGQAYTGGWDDYDSLQKDEFVYCEKAKINDEEVYKSLCAFRKSDLVVLKTVCSMK